MTVIQHRRGTTAEWAASSYILEVGEIGVEIDTSTTPDTVIGAKIGNGESLWAVLDYIGRVPTDLTNINSISFDTTPTDVPVGSGVLSWNSVDKTLDLQSEGITYQLGQELAQNVMRFDSSGLENGKVVYPTGSSGSNLLVDYAIATSDATSSNTFGVMTASASGGAKAPATTFGLVHDIDTSAMTEGATVWLSGTVAGGMTTTKPTAPVHTVKIGICVRSHATEGVVFVNAQNGFEVDELHDVLIGTKVDNNLLAYDSASGLWKNQTAAEANVAALSGATFSGTVVMNNVGVDINDTDSRVGRIIGSGNIMYIQGGADSADTTGRVVIGRTASSSNISQLDLRAETTTIAGNVSMTSGKQAAVVPANTNTTTGATWDTSGGNRVIMVAASTSAVAPNLRPDGSALVAGDIWIDW